MTAAQMVDEITAALRHPTVIYEETADHAPGCLRIYDRVAVFGLLRVITEARLTPNGTLWFEVIDVYVVDPHCLEACCANAAMKN